MRNDIVSAFCWTALSLFVMFGSFTLRIGSFGHPGPGLMPFLAGSFLFLLSITLIVLNLQKRWEKAPEIIAGGGNYAKIGLFVGSLIAHALLLDVLGYLVATFLLLMIIFPLAGMSTWKVVLLSSTLTAAGTYVFFTFLGVTFPMGFLG